MLTVTRAQVIAYRVAAQGLHREASQAQQLAVLAIGVQDAAGELARLAFDARLEAAPPTDLYGPGKPLALVWSLRGAPHVHRREDLDAVAAALFPLSEADATSRLNETGPSVARSGIPALEQFALATAALRAAVVTATGKGAASTAATKRLPAAMHRNCRACKASHLSDSAMRLASIAAGLELQPGTAPPVLQRRPKAKLATKPDLVALRRLLRAYLTLLGPATLGDAAGYLEARRADVEQAWPEDLVEVKVDGRSAWLPAACIKDLEKPPDPDLVRILGPFDPYMQARDRDVIVPDTSAKGVHKALWPVLGRPSVLFAEGEVVGTVRPRASGKKLTLSVEPFAKLPPSIWDEVEVEAQRVGTVRGFETTTVQRVE